MQPVARCASADVRQVCDGGRVRRRLPDVAGGSDEEYAPDAQARALVAQHADARGRHSFADELLQGLGFARGGRHRREDPVSSAVDHEHRPAGVRLAAGHVAQDSRQARPDEIVLSVKDLGDSDVCRRGWCAVRQELVPDNAGARLLAVVQFRAAVEHGEVAKPWNAVPDDVVGGEHCDAARCVRSHYGRRAVRDFAEADERYAAGDGELGRCEFAVDGFAQGGSVVNRGGGWCCRGKRGEK